MTYSYLAVKITSGSNGGWEGETQGQTVQLNEHHLFFHSSFNFFALFFHTLKSALFGT